MSEEERKISFIQIIKELKHLLIYMKPYKREYKYVLIITTFLSLIGLTGPLIDKFVVDNVLVGKNIKMLWWVVLIYCSSYVINNTFNITRSYLTTHIGNLLTIDIRQKLLRKILNKKEGNSDIASGYAFVAFDKDVYYIQDVLMNTIFNFIFVIFNVVIAATILIITNSKFFLIILITMPISILNNNLWFRKLYISDQRIRQNVSDMFSFISHVLENTKIIKEISSQKYIEKKYIRYSRNLMNSIFQQFKYSNFSSLLGGAISLTDVIITLFVGAYLIYQGQITLGTYYALLAYKSNFVGNIGNILNFKINMCGIMVSIKRLKAIQDLSVETTNGKSVSKVDGDIEFKNVNFSYPSENKTYQIKNFNLKISKGQKVAIVGESGSGKSTIINLLLRIYEINSGDIFVDGNNLKDLNIISFRKRIGISTSQNFFFNDTIMENITLGKKNNLEDIDRLSVSSQASQFINADNDKYNKILEQNAKNLSDGQKQRISILRMLLKKTDMLLLDEGTSALDNITEAEVFKEIKKYAEDKTIIAISHRLSPITSFDVIVVMEEGEVIEKGTHSDLMALKGYYYNLYMKENVNK